jgi:hypothetical protein
MDILITNWLERKGYFQCASSLDLNMGYYQIKLDADADADSQKLCTIVFP